VPVNTLKTVPCSNLVPVSMTAGCCQLSFDSYHLSGDDEAYLTSNNVPEITPWLSDWAASLFTATGLYVDSPPEAPKNWELINPTLNDYHSEWMEISSTFWLPDTFNWWRQQEDTHSKYAELSNVARHISTIISDGLRVVSSFSLRQDIIGWRQSIPQARPCVIMSL